MNLELENRPAVRNPDAAAIGKSLAGVQGFAILSKDEMTYIQASGSAKDGFWLEYQEGDTEQHYHCLGRLSLEQATKAFVSYAQADEYWRTSVPWRRAAESEPTPAWSIRRHIGWDTLFTFVGFFGTGGGYIYYKFHFGYFPPMLIEGMIFFGLVLLGFLVPRAIFRHLIGAKCQSPGCTGKAFPKGRNPIVYVCKSCRRIYDTGMSEGDSGMRPSP